VLFDLHGLELGILLFILALALWFTSWAIIRLITRTRQSVPPVVSIAEGPEPSHNEAVLIIMPGGRLGWVNQIARKMFDLQQGEIPNLEKLSARLRPSELFINLCANEGQARFVLDGRMVLATSYQLNVIPGGGMMIALRYPELTAGISGIDDSLSSQTLRTFTELAQAMAANLDLEATLQAVMESVDKLLAADFLEITIWETDGQYLQSYRFSGLSGMERKVEQTNIRYHPGEGYSGFLAQQREALLISNTETQPGLDSGKENTGIPIRSYLGVPLLVSQEFIGTLELGSLIPGTFQQTDLELIQLTSKQAAVAVHNALLYRMEQRRADELSGLAQLTQAFSSMRDPKSLYERLVQSIVPLIHTNIIGFLLYNENRRALEGQDPFYGIPSQFLGLYRIEMSPNSKLEQSFLKQEAILSENPIQDATWQELGLDVLAHGASLRETALIPLSSGGRMLGYLQASNHSDGSITFSKDELRILSIIANQAAPIIENVTLIEQTRMRALRAEALRRIGNLASSAANLNEILEISLRELAGLLGADVAAAFLMDQNRMVLQFHPASLFGRPPLPAEAGWSLSAEDPQFPFSVTGTQHAMTLGIQPQEGSQPIIPFYQHILDTWQMQSAVVVPLIVRDEGIGEVWLGSKEPEFFGYGDMQVVVTAAGQLAGVVDQANLINLTDESLRRRVEQLTTLTQTSQELSTSLDLNSLMQLVYGSVLRTARAECGGILLFDLDRPLDASPVVRLSTGDVTRSKLSDLEEEALKHNEPLHVADFADSPYAPPHDHVQSMLIVPILYQGQQAGLIELHSTTARNFDNSAIEIVQSLASQAAIALANAYQYESLMQRTHLLKRELETHEKLFEVYQELRGNNSLRESLQVIAKAIQEATPFQAVLFSGYEPLQRSLRRLCAVGIPPEVWEEMSTHTQPWTAISHLLLPDYQVGICYFIPADRRPIIPRELQVVDILAERKGQGEEFWDPKDLLVIPLYDSANSPLGLLSVDSPRDGRRPDRATFEALALFAMQASLLMESMQHISSLQTHLNDSEVLQRRQEEAVANAQKNLPLLLHKDLDNTITIQNLERRVQQARAGLEMAVLSSRQSNLDGVVRAMASEMLTRFELQTALIAEINPGGPRLVEVMGSIPATVKPEALFGQRNPLRQILEDKQPILCANLATDPTWQQNPLLTALEGKSFIGLPLSIGDGRAAGVLAVGGRPLPPFTEEDRQIFTQLTSQVGLALQNLHYIDETNRRLQELDNLLAFSRKLSNLNPDRIIEALSESILQILPTAQACWVGIWNRQENCLEVQKALGYSDNQSLIGMRFRPTTQTSQDNSNISDDSLPIRVFQSGKAVRVAEIKFSRDYILSPDDLVRYRQGTAGKLPISNMLVPLSRGANKLGLVVLDHFGEADIFNAEDEALVLALTQQAALALETARLFIAAEERTTQLRTLTQAAGTITSSLKQEELTQQLLDLLKQVIPYDTATLWLRRGDVLAVAATRGFVDTESRVGISVALEDSLLFQSMMQTGQPISVADVRKDERFPAFVEHEYLSWLGIPLLAKSELVGVIALEKVEGEFYTPEHIQVGTTFAGQAAVAMENARLFEESQQRAADLDERSKRLALLNRLSSELTASLDEGTILQVATQQFLTALNCSLIGVVMVAEKGHFVLQAETPAIFDDLPLTLPSIPLMERLIDSTSIFSSQDINQEEELQSLMGQYFIPRQTTSLLMVPLMAGSNLYGWFWLQNQKPYRYSAAEIELARTISNQASVAIQNARLFAETRRLTEDLEQRVQERTAELMREHQSSQTLLNVITELSTSLDLGMVLTRTLNVLNESLGSEQSLILISSGQKVHHVGKPLVNVPPPGPFGEVREGLQLEREIARWVMRRKVSALVEDITQDGRWKFNDKNVPSYRSLVAVPLILGEEVLGTLMLFHEQPSTFIIEQVNVLEAAARQISITLNNAELFSLIRDQAENLGSMLREQQIEASRSRAILEAVADGVLVTNDKSAITLFNNSAERILGLQSTQVVGQSLEHFIGLFGKAGQSWMLTINEWSGNPKSYQGEIFSEQINLDNGQVVSVHLTPVIWRKEFLGTVSIFRDITKEVQVDRLKSEFVANVSHELRTPMTSIKGYVEIMLMGAAGQISPQQTRFLEIVKANTERLTILVNDLLDVSRIEAGRVTLDLQALEMQDIVEDVFSYVRRRSREENKPMEFLLEASHSLPKVTGDLERVQQVLNNLVVNAYNYTPANGRILVRLRPMGQEVQVDVIDNGVGIAPKDHKRIFERFYRGEDPLVLSTAGTGLGLALSKTLIEMHHGRIWFSSSGVPGEGSTFSFTLPVYNED